MADHELKTSDIARIEHKIDLLLRIQGLTCDQIEHLVAAKGAGEAQQALIEKLKVARTVTKDAPKV